MHLLCVHRAEHLQIGRSDGLFSGGGGGNYSSSPPSQIKGGLRRCAPALSQHFVVRLNPLRGFILKSSANKKTPTLSGWGFVIGGGGGNYSSFVLTPSQIKGGRRRCAPALSHHFVVRLNPLRGFIPSSSQKPKKATLSGDLFWFFGGGGGNWTRVRHHVQ